VGSLLVGKLVVDGCACGLCCVWAARFVRSHPRIKLKVLKRLGIQILTGLEYLHNLSPPIIHRDVKCENILYDACSGDLKIGDLGMAMQLDAASATASDDSSDASQDGVSYVPLGTPCFMAPELYDGSYTRNTDIYSFGMCFLEMVTRRTPYSECTNTCQIFRRVNGVRFDLPFPPSLHFVSCVRCLCVVCVRGCFPSR
jgi:WNK lysine deficient protein kinase